MIRQTANAHKSTHIHTHARARQKVYYHCYVRSLPPGLVDYEMPGILAARLAAMRQNRKLLTRCHSIALPAAASSALRGGRGEVAPLAAAATATAAFSFPSLLLRASFTVSGLKTSSP